MVKEEHIYNIECIDDNIHRYCGVNYKIKPFQ